MFGLMRPQRQCGKSCHQWTREHRMHYCGTCKVIGNQYGHQARLFLNFDIVFLSELLSDLNQERLGEWTAAYQAINRCFTMPTEADQTPFSLEYTATANTILSALKVDDNIKDQKKWRWYFARRFYRRSFRKAFEQMESWGVPKEHFFYWIDLQMEREKSVPTHADDLMDYLHFYAAPTAELTALIFEQGIKTTQPQHQITFRQLGYNFGLLMYILDAFEDVERDIFERQFNPLVNWFEAKETLIQPQLVEVRQLILSLQHQLCEGFKALPLRNSEQYSARLVSNLAMRIYKDRHIPSTWRQYQQQRWEEAKTTAQNIVCNTDSFFSNLQYFLVASSIFFIPSVAGQMPQQEGKIQWKWTTFWQHIFPFAQQPDHHIKHKVQYKPSNKKKNDDAWIPILCCCSGTTISLPALCCCITKSKSAPSSSPVCQNSSTQPSCNCNDCGCIGTNGQCCCNECLSNCHNDRGQCCCDTCDCCKGGGSSGGCDCCKGGSGGGGCDCCKGGGGSGGCDCCKGGGGGGGCDCCKGGGGGGGCDCCKGGGSSGGCDCCKGGGGGGGNCCRHQVDDMSCCAGAELESLNGLMECFWPWHC